jgi:ferredoxin
MKTVIYFYTGTGNSLWTARKLSELLGKAELVPIALHRTGRMSTDVENVGFVFPVHIWGVPSPVIDFLKRDDLDPKKYYFAIAVHAGQVAATLVQLKKILQQKSILLSSGFSICLPSNYIAWSGAESDKKQQKKFSQALDKIKWIAQTIRDQETREPEKGPLWQNILFSVIYRGSYHRVPLMDKPFFADEKCTGCQICEKVCPAHNIEMNNGKPVWQHQCEQCFACIQWCPEEAIQYGKGTSGRRRYHHPEISLKDMLACKP